LAAAFEIVSYQLSGVHLSNLNPALGATCRAQFAEGSGFFCPNHQRMREPPKHELERDKTYDGQSEQNDQPHESTPWTWLVCMLSHVARQLAEHVSPLNVHLGNANQSQEGASVSESWPRYPPVKAGLPELAFTLVKHFLDQAPRQGGRFAP